MKFIIQYLSKVSKFIPNRILQLFISQKKTETQLKDKKPSTNNLIEDQKDQSLLNHQVIKVKQIGKKTLKSFRMNNRKRKSFKSFLQASSSSSQILQIGKRNQPRPQPSKIAVDLRNIENHYVRMTKRGGMNKSKNISLRKSKMIKKVKACEVQIAEDCTDKVTSKIFKNADGLQISFIKTGNSVEQIIQQESDTELLRFIRSTNPANVEENLIKNKPCQNQMLEDNFLLEL